jgi:hypothetical protein
MGCSLIFSKEAWTLIFRKEIPFQLSFLEHSPSAFLSL